jgi:IS1 family transposase
VMNTLAADKRQTVLHLLVEGNSIRSTERITGVHRDTIIRLMVKTGNECRDFLDDTMRGLKLRHLQLDEIWTFVDTKQAHIKPDRVGDDSIGDQYLFVAFDQDTKLIPTFALGKRTAAVTERFMLDLADRIVHQPGIHIPQLSTDGFTPYPAAVDLAFADEATYGIIIKDYRESEQPGRYGPPELTGTVRRPVRDVDPKTICTSHVERQNLNFRLFIRRFTRLSLGFSKKRENLAAAIALNIAYHNFCRRPIGLRVSPAMAAGVTDRLWKLDDLVG